MVGDGINDLLSMSKASVSVAANGSLSEGLKTSDVYITRSGLTPLKRLHEIAVQSNRSIHVNIGFSIAYNLIGAGFAVFGFVSPLVAAVLMPRSSSLVVSTSLLSTKGS